jgi:hypothetical protein
MLAALGLFVAVTQSNAPIVVDGELCHPRNLMVKYADDEALRTLRYAAPVIRVFPQIHYAVVRAKPGMLRAARKQLSSWRGVQHVEYDRCAKPAYDPNDEYWPNEWHMRAIRANYAWDTQRGDPNVAVAVIDTGVFTDHPDLAANIWVNSGEVPGNGVDDDNDGYVDDVNGYDFSNGDAVPNDVYGHGTACSGLVAGVQDNTIGVTGVAPGCKIMALKASTDDGYFYDSNNVAAYLFAADHGARVLSMSFFSDRVSQSERDGIDYCWTHGVLPVAASGNSASVLPYYPGAYDHVLSVAAVDGNLNKAGFSDYGSWVCVSAPGTGLYTTTNNGSYTSGFAGTSGACPHVAGLAALCFSANPLASPQDVMNAIEDTATLQNQAPYGEFSLYGLVNAEMAVARMSGGPVTAHPPALKYVSSIASVPISGGVSDTGVIRGRGFENGVTLTSGGRRVPVASVSRNYIEFSPSSVPGNLTLTVNGTQVDSLTFPAVDFHGAYPMNEASTQSATLTGGFKETLNPDGTVMTVSRRSDGSIVLQGTFHHVVPGSSFSLTLRRLYTTTTVGTETVQLYDWSSASYPYGSFVTIGSGNVPLSMTTSAYTVNNPSRFVDPEGTVYLLITTSTNLASGTQLRLDMSYLQSQ